MRNAAPMTRDIVTDVERAACVTTASGNPQHPLMSVIGSSANQYETRPAGLRMTVAHSLSISLRI